MDIDERIFNPMTEDALEPFVDAPAPLDPPPWERAYDDSDDVSRALRLLKEVNLKPIEETSVLMPNLIVFLRHNDPVVVRQSIATGTNIFCAVLTKMALQLFKSSKVEGWLEEAWSRMVQFKDAVCGIVSEPGSVGTKIRAAKFLEICFLLFTAEGNDNDIPNVKGEGSDFCVSWFQGYSVVNQTFLAYEANQILDLLIDMLHSAHTLAGSLVITVVCCLASVAKKRPAYYSSILSTLLGFDSNFDTSVGGHAASIRYSLRTAFLGFLRCNHQPSTESRDKLLRTLRAMNPGEATDQMIRQVEKMSRSSERNSRDIRINKDDFLSSQISITGDLIRVRPAVAPGDIPAFADEMPAKRTRTRHDTGVITNHPAVPCDLQDADDDISSSCLEASLVDTDDTPVGKMIKAIGALLGAGDMGLASINILISNTQADLMADIVIETMKHLPKGPIDISGQNGSVGTNSQTSSSIASQSVACASATVSGQVSSSFSELAPTAVTSGISTSASDIPSAPNLLSDVKRDPRRDPRRLDPRRAVAPVGSNSIQVNSESISDMQNGWIQSPSRSLAPEIVKVETAPFPVVPESEVEQPESFIDPPSEQRNSEETSDKVEFNATLEPSLEDHAPSILVFSPVREVNNDCSASTPPAVSDEGRDDDMLESDHYSSTVSMTPTAEEICHDLPVLPLYVELMNVQKKKLQKLAITRIIEDCKQIRAAGSSQSRLPLFARLLSQTDVDDDIIVYFQKHIILDYHHQKGHDLAMHVLYQLHSVMISDLEKNLSSSTNKYEKFFLAIAKTLLDSLPASDKSFSRLFGEAPLLPESALRLLEDLCHLHGYDQHTRDIFDGDRITQGLGAVWSLILGRPHYRQACLDIALKCCIHSHDEVRSKAIRLVANKLFLLNYASETIAQFARSMLLSVVDHQPSEAELKTFASSDQHTETGSQETSISGSHGSEPGISETEPIMSVQTSFQNIPAISLLHAQQQMSLFFALCTKKPNLLHLLFEIYGRAPKPVKQSIHRHVPILMRTLGSSYSDLLVIISDPPEGSENLIVLVLQVMTDGSPPSTDLIAAVKHLYHTKLKDVAILIPMLSSLSKDEVLPIFPRLIDLPLEKFQAALARILQGSAHTGPALTPVEVLIAVHNVDPEIDGVALKKITDACTACFEQRTVFTQHVLAKSLSHMVEQVPLPLLFMRTVIQAIDAFPPLVDFVMGILDKLVKKQIWKMPKLWVGFLKLASQTQPHSFEVLLQLPPPQLESALNRYTNLRAPLASYANQPDMRTSLSRHTLKILGLAIEPQQVAPRLLKPAGAMQTSDTGSSVHGAALT